MIILGVILLVIGFVIGLQILYIIGIILSIAGVVLLLAGGIPNRPIGGRRYWF